MTDLYDRLTANPPPDRHEIGTEDGETCGRYPEPDEDEPRGYKRKPCAGEMVREGVDQCSCEDCNEASSIVCDTCGELA